MKQGMQKTDIIFSDHDRTGLANIIRGMVGLNPGKSHFFRRNELEILIQIIRKKSNGVNESDNFNA